MTPKERAVGVVDAILRGGSWCTMAEMQSLIERAIEAAETDAALKEREGCGRIAASFGADGAGIADKIRNIT